MRFVDPLPRPVAVLTAATWTELCALIDQTIQSATDPDRISDSSAALANAQAEVARSHAQIGALRASNSWKVTAPFRAIKLWLFGQALIKRIPRILQSQHSSILHQDCPPKVRNASLPQNATEHVASRVTHD
jgi:hypothetical protein